MEEMRVEDPPSFFNFLTMPAEMFDELVKSWAISYLLKLRGTPDVPDSSRSRYVAFPMNLRRCRSIHAQLPL